MKPTNAFAALALLAAPLVAQDPAKPAALAPGEIVAAAPSADWTAIAVSDLLVVDLAPDGKGKPRRVVIQLMPAPFSQGWIGNIRKLAAAQWWNGTSVNRVQDNYVVQWGDASEKKVLPAGLAVVPQSEYLSKFVPGMFKQRYTAWGKRDALQSRGPMVVPPSPADEAGFADAYTVNVGFASGFPIGMTYAGKKGYVDPLTDKGVDQPDTIWPVHCYGMVGVGRDLPPNTGTGAELYAVIGHAPRHLDRNIAIVGRVIEGIEHLSALPRGTGPLGFYETAEERVPIKSVRLLSEMEVDPAPRYEYLSTTSTSFAAYAEARANRRDPFFIRPAGGADICNIPVPVRRVKL